MARNDSTVELTDAEKRDLVALIQAGKRLPEKYRFILFEDKREVELVCYDAKDKHSIAVELTDFSVYYTQGAMDTVVADLREGKSQVVCDGGQLYKVSKSKAGVVSRDRLTKAWTDWVDYWAVDFDYGSRKELVKRPRGLGATRWP